MPQQPTFRLLSNPFFVPTAEHSQHLTYWVNIRWLCLLVAISAYVFSTSKLALEIPPLPVLTILGLLALLNIATHHRLKNTLPVAALELGIHLITDVLLLAALFYTTGGVNNPFISYFLIPVCIAAATLSLPYIVLITLLTISIYSVLLVHFIPLTALSPSHAHGAEHGINLHLIGMLINFFVSALLIGYFVFRLAHDLRAKDKELSLRREEQLRDEQLVAVATLAAGTAHELSTPLNTIHLLIDEMLDDHKHPQELVDDLKLIKQQISLCSDTLRHLRHTADMDSPSVHADITTFCLKIIERFQLLRPHTHITHSITSNASRYPFEFPRTIEQAITNLLNNAADASPERIDIDITWDADYMIWIIKDFGDGIDPLLLRHVGKRAYSTKHDGMGIGLLLSHASIDKLGGEIIYIIPPSKAYNITKIVLPISRRHLV